MTAPSPLWISAEEVFSRVSYSEAIRAIQRELRAGLDPSADFARSILDVEHGQLLLMPSRSADYVGVKVATVAPHNPTIGKERIQAIYLLMDSATLTPVAMMDGTALTTLRTPAVSLAVAELLAPAEVDHLVVFGSGPQAWGHIQAARAVREVGRISIVGRNPGSAQLLAERVSESGTPATVGSSTNVADAQLIVCATTASHPLFDGSTVPDDSCTIAVGSHDENSRELDSVLMSRAQVVVEDRAVALREAGDIILPIDEGHLEATSIVAMRDILTENVPVDTGRPRVFKSSGMPWEDLVVASEVYRRG